MGSNKDTLSKTHIKGQTEMFDVDVVYYPVAKFKWDKNRKQGHASLTDLGLVPHTWIPEVLIKGETGRYVLYEICNVHHLNDLQNTVRCWVYKPCKQDSDIKYRLIISNY